MIDEQKLSMRERILSAPAKEMIDMLLILGSGLKYRFASTRTRARWRAAARKRRKELANGS